MCFIQNQFFFLNIFFHDWLDLIGAGSMVMGENCIKYNDCSHTYLCSEATRKELMRNNLCERQTETGAVQRTNREGRAA